MPTEGKKKKVVGMIVLILSLSAIVSVILYIRYRDTHIVTDDAFIDGDINYVTPLIPGKVKEVLAHENEHVEKDQVLVRLDTSDIDAELTAARENLDVVRNQLAGQYASINVVSAQISQFAAQRELIKSERERLKNLLERGAVSQDEYDKVNAQYKAVRAQINAAYKQRKQIRTSIGEKSEDGKEAAIRLAEARIAQIELKLEHAVIRAPSSGYITRKNVNVGQVIQAGQPIMAVVPLQDLYITANFKETDLTKVRPGQKVIFKVDTYPGIKFEGKVKSIMAGTGSAFSLLPPQNATGNYIKVVQRIPVRIEITGLDSEKYPLRVGMSAVPTILIE